MNKKKILIIDDNPAILDSMDIILTEYGYEVFTVLGGEALKKVIEEFEPDLIFIDVWLKEENGIRISRSLKEDKKTSGIPIVLISAASNIKDHLAESKADDFLPKPFELMALVEKAEQYS